jgi:hypothetical protein
MQKYYVYVHYRLDKEIPFYVGKGQGNRAYVTTGRNSWWTAIHNKTLIDVDIVKYFDLEDDAFAYEIELIAELSKNYTLCNLTSGGEGSSGYKHTNKTRAAISKKLSSKPTGRSTKTVIAMNNLTGEEQEFNGKVELEVAGFSYPKVYKACTSNQNTYAGYTFWFKPNNKTLPLEQENKG